jgi:hypothetical protein
LRSPVSCGRTPATRGLSFILTFSPSPFLLLSLLLP